MTRLATNLPLTLSEAAFQQAVIEAALWYRWRYMHQRPSPRRDGMRWETAISGHAGFPDLVLSRDGQVLLVELKTATGRLRPNQKEWLATLGAHGRLWRPADWPEIVATLRDGVAG